MALLKHRGIATAIVVVVMIVAVLIGVNRSVTRLAANVERGFYQGIMNDQGFREPSINSQLERVAEVSLNFASVLANYPELETEALLQARRDFLDADGISAKWASYFDLRSAIVRLMDAIEVDAVVELTERDFETAHQHLQTIVGAHSLINRLSREYNEMVEAALDGLSPLARLINTFIPARFPETLPYSR